MSLPTIVTTTRFACVPCDVLANGDGYCWNCGAEMTPADEYRNPCAAFYRNTMLNHLNGGQT